MSKSRAPLCWRSGQRGMFAEDVRRSGIVEGVAEAEPPRDAAHRPPVRHRLAGAARKPRWREISPLELVTEPSFSPQASAGNSTCPYCVVSVFATTSDDDERTKQPARRARDRRRACCPRDWCP